MRRGDTIELALLPLAVAWDALAGEPPNALHPVVWMGRAARTAERYAPGVGAAAQFGYGLGLAVMPPVVYGLVVERGWRAARRWPW